MSGAARSFRPAKPATQGEMPLNELETTVKTGVIEITVGKSELGKGSLSGDTSRSRLMRSALVVFLSVVLASCASHLLAFWVGIFRPPGGFLGIYRRVGPDTGPQALCAGSSLLVSALSWAQMSEALGQGMETWGIGGSSPDIWEVWQQQRPHSNMTIVGVSVYDLNETHLADERATVVPLSRTLNDLWASDADPALSHRILTQYALRYVRFLFPTAGNADKVLVGLRSKVAEMLGRQASLAEHEGVVLQPAPPLLDAGESTATINEWSSARLLRRIAVLRAENRGRHEFFNGPKRRALTRMLLQARRQGRVVIVVLPVSRAYAEAFLRENDVAAFERAIREAAAIVPEATVVRLDRISGISDPANFSDLVHLNSFGRPVTTQAFLAEVTKGTSQRKLAAPSTASITPGK